MKGLDSMRQKLRQINDISIGNNLRNLRNAANLTQEQVVAQLQLRNLPTTRSIYSQIEAGTYNIKISELIALSEILHTDFNTIFDGLSCYATYYFIHRKITLDLQFSFILCSKVILLFLPFSRL